MLILCALRAREDTKGIELTEVGYGSLEILEALEPLEILESLENLENLETPEALKTLIPSGLLKPPWRATDPQGLQTRGRGTKKEGPSRIAPQRTLESKKTAATYSPTGVQYHRRGRA